MAALLYLQALLLLLVLLVLLVLLLLPLEYRVRSLPIWGPSLAATAAESTAAADVAAVSTATTTVPFS